MGKVIKKQIQGMSWWMKTGLVLILTLATTVFMYEGWYKPKPAQAAITAITNETNVYHNAALPGATAASFAVGGTAGTRMLVVSLAYEASGSATMTATSVSYGGVAMTQAGSSFGTSLSQHSAIYYLKDNAVMDGTAKTLAVNITGGGTAVMQNIWYAVYGGVDQAATPTFQNYNVTAAAGATLAFGTGLSIPANGQGVFVGSASRATAAITWNAPANWTKDNNQPNGTTGLAYVASRTIPATLTTDTCSHTITTACRISMSAMGLAPYIVTDSTPPTVNIALAVNPDIATTYTSPNPILTATFTEAESTVSSCDYDAGAGWVVGGGVVSGSSPTWTCTASPTGLAAGTKTFQMRAISAGGTSLPTTLTRTVDTGVPTDGSLTVTPGNTQNLLQWTIAADSGSGINHYDLVYNFGVAPTAPLNCTTGTVVPGSPFSAATLTTTHTGLTNGTVYAYRLCATDNTGNFSTGITKSGTPISMITTITRCDGCHGYSPTVLTGATFDDGGSRNAAGLFQGSHNKHVIGQAIICSVCHVAPASETSTDFGHSTGTINLNASINGGSYKTGTTSILVTNTPAFGTCAGVSCHGQVYSSAAGTSGKWGTPGGGCSACHNSTADPKGAFSAAFGGPSTGGHKMHLSGNGIVCGNCHFGASSSSGGSLHGNGFINVTTGYLSTPRNRVAKRASAGAIYFACNNASCHANPYANGSLTTALWGTGSGGCVACHTGAGAFIAYSAPTAGNSATPQQNGPNTGSHSGHVNYGRYVCAECHAQALTGVSGGNKHGNGFINVTGAGGIYQPAGIAKHAIGTYSTTGCANACHMGVAGTAAPIWGSLLLGCVDCHHTQILRTKGRPGTYLADVTGEFGLAWGHKPAAKTPARGAVTSSDCIVCHLEGNFTTQKTSKWHADGNIDLRAPDALVTDANKGETPITNNSGATFTFARYSTSYAAGSRATTLGNRIDEVITVKFCLACHDSNGATNPTALTRDAANTTTTGTPRMPFGGVALGANYVANNNAVGVQGLIDVNTQVAAANSSRHPVGAANSRAFPKSTRLLAPYDLPTGRDGNTAVAAGTGTRVLAASAILVCDDCHTTGTTVTRRTITAHGNGVTVRGTFFGNPGSPLCVTCHIGTYNDTTNGNHNAGSGFGTSVTRPKAAMDTCQFCHTSWAGPYAAANRPRTATDVHGFNTMWGTTGGWTWGNATNLRPIAFLRNAGSWPTSSWRPYVGTVAGPGQFALTAGQATCGNVQAAFPASNSGTISCGSQTHTTYGPGGSY